MGIVYLGWVQRNLSNVLTQLLDIVKPCIGELDEVVSSVVVCAYGCE